MTSGEGGGILGGAKILQKIMAPLALSVIKIVKYYDVREGGGGGAKILQKIMAPPLSVIKSIDQVSTFNFLGLHINSQLTWQTHIDEISKKISRVIGLIYKLQYILPQKILLSLYNTLILPQINYCILLWGKESKSILLLQKRAIRAVSSAGFRAHSEPLFKIHNVLKVDDIYQQRLLVFYYNVVNNIISANFNDFLPVLSVGSHSYPIRNPQRQLLKHSHEYIKLSCRYQLTILSNEIFSITGKYYNTIIAEIFGNVRHIPVVSFKSYIKTYFLKKYSYLCHVDNCYICQV